MPICGSCEHETSTSDNFCGRCGAQQVSPGGDGHGATPLASSLCRTLRDCATRTFERLASDHYDRFVPREETYTSLNLQDLNRAHRDQVAIVPFYTHEETQNGADWEWWFYADDTGFGMRVQAKRALRAGGYRLEHHTRSGKRQSELLVEDALANGCVPAYVLYNHRNWVPRFVEGTTATCVHGAGVTSHMGCTIVSALTVHAVLRHHPISAAKVRDASMPWHRVLCDGARRSALDQAYGQVVGLHNRGLSELEAAIRAETQPPVSYSATPEPGPSPWPTGAGTASWPTGRDAAARPTPNRGEVPAYDEPQAPTDTYDVEAPFTSAEREEWEAARNARVREVLDTPLYRGVATVRDRPLGRLPDRVLDMIRHGDISRGPDERAAGAVLVNLSPDAAST
ncbi:DUF6615 family protein [Kitasatospora sp. NBC_01560]|uniref:DUF6615 family protein n=1 Tax=Kitasatospora sp. NBC_01560 TaxID=2975965 RepID=UPI0038644714